MSKLRPVLLSFAALACLSASATADVFPPGQGPSTAAWAQVFEQLPQKGRKFRDHVFAADSSLASAQLVRWEDALSAGREAEVQRISEHWAIHRSLPQDWSLESSSLRGSWLPGRRALMNQAAVQMNLEAAQEDFGLDGPGAIVGVVATGIDVAHPDFLDSAGKSRVAWLLALGRSPAELHPELEEEYGCTESNDCAIYSADDIDALIASGLVGALPRDINGHGSHVASIAAGRDEKFPGVAPGSDLIIVQASSSLGEFTDAAIAVGTRFIFEQATAMGRPAVVNLSLGSSLGPHDGSSPIEQVLTELASGPGRALVTAVGNSGEVYEGLTGSYGEPLGGHTDVWVAESLPAGIPVLTPQGPNYGSGALLLWVEVSDGAQLEVALANARGSQTDWVKPGEAAGFTNEDLGDEGVDFEVTIFNGEATDALPDSTSSSIFLVIDGSWDYGRPFELLLRGQGQAQIWVEGRGSFGLGGSLTGPLLPRATTSQTVLVPATAPELISVGSVGNRRSWRDYTGELVFIGGEERGVRSLFSSLGPNLDARIKPEILAPGEVIVAAMSSSADPRDPGVVFSQFSSAGSCADPSVECLVVDDEHAVSQGTSMASPVVAGAIALLMQRQPELTNQQAKDLLIASAVPTTRMQALDGPGRLNIESLLLAQEAQLELADESRAPVTPSSEQSRIIFADRFLRPGASAEALVLLRSEEGRAAGPLGRAAYRVLVDGPASVEIVKEELGQLELELRADEGSAMENVQLKIFVEERLLAQAELEIAVDSLQAEFGLPLVGGCDWSGARGPGLQRSARADAPRREGGLASLWLLSLVCLCFFRRRRL
ncbi:MAG: S8 family serine peptidase [Polyangiaceae bacterium]|nr:S8 family serine peptidase [Polyangiaceae bacterium]